MPNDLLRRDIPSQEATSVWPLVLSLGGRNSFHHEEKFILTAGKILVKSEPVFPSPLIEIFRVDLELGLKFVELPDPFLVLPALLVPSWIAPVQLVPSWMVETPLVPSPAAQV